MSPTLAKKRYLKTTAVSMLFYVIVIMGVAFYLKDREVSDIIKYSLAILPTIFVWWFLWGAIRFYKETDEYERSNMVGGMLAGVVVLLLISSSWGFLEMLADAPKLPIFWILPIFFVASGLWQAFSRPKGERC